MRFRARAGLVLGQVIVRIWVRARTMARDNVRVWSRAMMSVRISVSVVLGVD